MCVGKPCNVSCASSVEACISCAFTTSSLLCTCRYQHVRWVNETFTDNTFDNSRLLDINIPSRLLDVIKPLVSMQLYICCMNSELVQVELLLDRILCLKSRCLSARSSKERLGPASSQSCCCFFFLFSRRQEEENSTASFIIQHEQTILPPPKKNLTIICIKTPPIG